MSLDSKDKAPGKASKQPSLLFAQGQLWQTRKPQDFQKGWGRRGEPSCLPGATCPDPASCRRWEDKVYICAIKYHTSFQILYSVVVEEETEAHQPPWASIRQSKVKPTVSFSLE